MADAVTYDVEEERELVAVTAPAAAGEIWQMPDGRAAVFAGANGNTAAAGDKIAFCTEGQFTVTKTSGEVWLDGAPIYWDHSANAATCVPPLTSGDRDFFLGSAVGDVATGVTSGVVNLNKEPVYIIDSTRDIGDTTVVLTLGTPYIYNRGGALVAGFSATAEAQKLDWLSKRSFALGSNFILEAVVEVVTNADADVADLSIGVANASHASDADSITESAFFHFDMGADLNLDAESDDGTTEVAATDTTVNWAVGTPLHLVIDGRDTSDLQMYVNGDLVLGDTTFDISDATGPLKALFHLEKSSNDSPGEVKARLRVRTSEQ